MDPIVFPGVEPTMHLHYFTGALPGKNDTTVERISHLPNNCHWPHNEVLAAGDKNLYWMPQPYFKGTDKPVPLGQNNAYYRVPRGVDPRKIQSPPHGLRVVVGNPMALGSGGNPRPQRGITFRCPGVKDSGKPYPVDCTGKDNSVKLAVKLPSCSNGQNDSRDHRSHLAFPGKNGCPKSHPRPIPQLAMNFGIKTPDARKIEFRNHDGGVIAPHGDFFNATDTEVWKRTIERCMKGPREVGGCEGTGVRGKPNPR